MSCFAPLFVIIQEPGSFELSSWLGVGGLRILKFQLPSPSQDFLLTFTALDSRGGPLIVKKSQTARTWDPLGSRAVIVVTALPITVVKVITLYLGEKR